MSDTVKESSGNSAWAAGAAALVGALAGEGGVLGGNRNAVTADQMNDRFNSLQGQISTDALQAQIGRLQGQVASTGADSTIALGAAIVGVKDAVVASASQNALSLCGLGHTIQAGFASTKETILLESARTRELQLTDALAQARAATAAAHNDARHTATQVMIQNLASAGGSGN